MRYLICLLLAALLTACGNKTEPKKIETEETIGLDATAEVEDPESAESASAPIPADTTTTTADNTSEIPTNPLRDAYFGELHIHTAYSLDAFIFGNSLNDPFLAYRFAKGETVKLPTGVEKKIVAPLDFAAVTDHAEALGEYEICTNPEMKGYETKTCKGMRANEIRYF